MIRSMTGYGRAEMSFETCTITVEVRAVNNRYLDVGVKIPRAYIFAEDSLRSQVQKSVSRGKVDVFVTLSNLGSGSVSVSVNEPLALAYIAAFKRLSVLGEGVIDVHCPASDLARFTDVLNAERQEEDQDVMKAQFLEVLDTALGDFNAMREQEGAKLAEDILRRGDTIEKILAQVEARSPQTVADYRARLEAKMAEVLENAQIDESRILMEAALFADKIAVDEETVRLHSHLDQLRALLGKGGTIGRKLDFLIQEFNREANTIGSKCNDLEISRHVVDMKAEIEKIREQVQNIE